jgi:putative transposase
MDNVFIERLWRSLKYEDVYLKGYVDGRDAQRGIASWIAFYNEQRPHQALTDRAPMAVWREAIAGDGAVDIMDNVSRCPHPHSDRTRPCPSRHDREKPSGPDSN